MASIKEGLKKNGTLRKGYKYAKGGRVVKVAKKENAQTGLFGGVVKARKKYTPGSRSNAKADAQRSAMKPGKRRSRSGKLYYEGRKNRSDINGRD
jgi:hypothetical protein